MLQLDRLARSGRSVRGRRMRPVTPVIRTGRCFAYRLADLQWRPPVRAPHDDLKPRVVEQLREVLVDGVLARDVRLRQVAIDGVGAFPRTLSADSAEVGRRWNQKFEHETMPPVHLIESPLRGRQMDSWVIDRRGIRHPFLVENRVAFVEPYEGESEVHFSGPKGQKAIQPPAFCAQIEIALLRPPTQRRNERGLAASWRPRNQEMAQFDVRRVCDAAHGHEFRKRFGVNHYRCNRRGRGATSRSDAHKSAGHRLRWPSPWRLPERDAIERQGRASRANVTRAPGEPTSVDSPSINTDFMTPILTERPLVRKTIAAGERGDLWT